LIKSLTGIRPVVPVGDLVLGFGMAIVAFATLKYNALVKREALERDAVYAWIGALAIALVYAGGMMLGQANPLNTPIAALAVIIALALTTHMLIDPLKIYFSQVVGVRLGIMSPGDIKEMEQLYREASRVKRRRHPAVELFENDERTVKRLLDLLTPRQREIITLRAKGLSDKQIADVLAIKLPTVRKHIEDIKERLGSRDKADCAVYCIVTGLLSKEDLDDWFDSLKIGEVQE
ncbi:MAG: helix-turn-helix transcriptional regulator, partial [Chloroflexi bacterium]|nr:helix-turn-helix transcriptional regulator [Chloroflexota bacterium]